MTQEDEDEQHDGVGGTTLLIHADMFSAWIKEEWGGEEEEEEEPRRKKRSEKMCQRGARRHAVLTPNEITKIQNRNSYDVNGLIES